MIKEGLKSPVVTGGACFLVNDTNFGLGQAWLTDKPYRNRQQMVNFKTSMDVASPVMSYRSEPSTQPWPCDSIYASMCSRVKPFLEIRTEEIRTIIEANVNR